VSLGLIRSKDILPQRVTSPSYQTVLASPPAEQEGGIAYLRLKPVSTTLPNFLIHSENPLLPRAMDRYLRKSQKYEEKYKTKCKVFYMMFVG
jgi:hypothetical protein